MRDNNKLLVVGAGAQAKYVCEIFWQRPEPVSFCVLASEGSDHMDWPGAYEAGYKVGFDHIEALAGRKEITRAIICIADPAEKQHLTRRVRQAGLSIVSALHPAAVIASTAKIGAGVIINAGAVLQPFSQVGQGTMIHTNVIVEHDCQIGDFANLAPGVSLAGWVKVGDRATVYTGASVIPGCSIGEGAIVGAGATVIKDVAAQTRVAGTPARLLS